MPKKTTTGTQIATFLSFNFFHRWCFTKNFCELWPNVYAASLHPLLSKLYSLNNDRGLRRIHVFKSKSSQIGRVLPQCQQVFYCLFFLPCSPLSSFSLYLLGIASTTLSTSPYGGTSVTWKILAGTISSDCSFYSESKDASISVAVGFVTEREAFFKDSKSSIKCESICAWKILVLARFERDPVEWKISEAHALTMWASRPRQCQQV